MNSWPSKKMSEITRLITDGKHGDCEDEDGSGYFFLSSKDLRDGKLHYDKPRQITHAGFLETHTRTNLEPGDVLLTNCGASIGRVGIAQDEPRIYRTTFQKSISVIKPDRSLVDGKYLYYFLLCNSRLLINLGDGTAQPNLLIGDLKRIEVLVPPASVQRRIAGILSAYDNLIENNQRRIKILEEMARSLYREWFVNFRYPGHEKVPLVDSPLGAIPKGWEIVPFTEIADVLSGGTPKTDIAEYWDGDIPFFTPRDAPMCFYVQDTDKHISQVGLSNCASELYPSDTVFITARGTVGKVALPAVRMAMNQSCYALQAKIGFSQRFLFLMTLQQVDYFKTNTGGATFDTIVVDTFRRMHVIRPDCDLVAEFTARINVVFEQVKTLQRQTINLRRTRDLLLPKLISGELSVKGMDILSAQAVASASAV